MSWIVIRAWSVLCGLAVLAGCGADPAGAGGEQALGSVEQAFINGDDDRREFFELEDREARLLMERSLVALVPSPLVRPLTAGNLGALSTWGENHGLCEGEPFGDQPTAAFCSGVLVDWDLVLTSGHCVNVFALSQVRAVFGFYFREPGELAVTGEDVYRVAEVLTARDDRSQGTGERLDYAWLRLQEPVSSPHAPAGLRARARAVEVGDALVAINAGGGAPIKFDGGARVRQLRSDVNDYFVADTDTSEGSSGGPAFDEELRLVGTLARGAPDYAPTEEGCQRTASESDPELAREQFTYAFRSVEGLCEVDPGRWLCDTSCEDCEPPPPPPSDAFEDGCAFTPPRAKHPLALGGAVLALALAAVGSRRRLRAG